MSDPDAPYVDTYEQAIVSILNKLADLAIALGFDLPADPDAQPTLAQVERTVETITRLVEEEPTF